MNRRPYMRKMHTFWWLEQGRYTLYMVRELTCVFIGAYAIIILVGLFRLSQGPAAYGAYLDALQSPGSVAFLLLAFIFALFHSMTWFNLTPQAMPMRVGGKPIPGAVIIAVHYIVWLAVSAGLVFMAGV